MTTRVVAFGTAATVAPLRLTGTKLLVLNALPTDRPWSPAE